MTEDLALIHISDTLLYHTGDILQSFSKLYDSEGIVYWFGIESYGKSVVTSLIVPQADTKWGCISTSAAANAQVVSSIIGTPLVLIGQAHSHPKANVHHSKVDDTRTFARFEGAISVVVPHFGRRGVELRRCGIHRFISGQYGLVDPRDVSQHLVVVSGHIDLRS